MWSWLICGVKRQSKESAYVSSLGIYRTTCGVIELSPESQLGDHIVWANDFVPHTVNHNEEALKPRLSSSDLCYTGRSQSGQLSPNEESFMTSAFDHSLVISSLRLEPLLLRASLLSESIQPNRKLLFSTGNPPLVFNKVFFSFFNSSRLTSSLQKKVSHV